MNLIRVCILDYDRQYAEALARSLALYAPDIQIELYPKELELNSVDVILINERDRDTLSKELAKSSILLSDEFASYLWKDFFEEKESTMYLYKYQQTAQIAAAVRLFYGKRYGKANPLLTLSQPPVLTGVFSGAGGAGCTSAAVTLGRRLAEEQARVLFLSFEEPDSSAFYLMDGEGIELTENEYPALDQYLYQLFQKQIEAPLCTYLSAFLYQDSFGLFSFYPSRGRNPLHDLTCCELYTFLECLGRFGGFDCIVMDLANGLREQTAYLLDCCDCKVLCERDDLCCRRKNERQLRRLEGEFQVSMEELFTIKRAAENLHEDTLAENQGEGVIEIVEAVRKLLGARDVFDQRDHRGGAQHYQFKA